MGLYFSGFVVFARTSCEGLGEPTRSRAISRTVTAAENFFFFRFFGMKILLSSQSIADHSPRFFPHRFTFIIQKCNNRKQARIEPKPNES